MGNSSGFDGFFQGSCDKLLTGKLLEGLGAFSCGGNFIRHWFKIAWRAIRVKHLKRKKPGALRHRTYRVPLLPSGPGGFRGGYEHSAWLLALQMLRRDRDSNPRYPYEYTRLPIAHLRPLGHLSKRTETRKKTPALSTLERGRSAACGERGIRTLETHKGLTVFETARFSRSRISPNEE